MEDTLRVDIRVTPEVKQMLYEISKLDSRSITKEIEHLIKQRYQELGLVKKEDLKCHFGKKQKV